MPTSWWGKTIVVVYIIGYWLYVSAAAIDAWPLMGWFQWWNYVVWQACYAVFWRIDSAECGRVALM
jgi:hypothetical protein